MFVSLLKSKIHKAYITEANLNYTGSIGIDMELLQKSSILPYEKVLIVNNNNGARFETYAIPETKKGHICLNGAAARLGQVNDPIIIMSFLQVPVEKTSQHKPIILYMSQQNKINKISNK